MYCWRVSQCRGDQPCSFGCILAQLALSLFGASICHVVDEDCLSMQRNETCDWFSSKYTCNRTNLYCFEIMLHAVVGYGTNLRSFPHFRRRCRQYLFSKLVHIYFSELIAGHLCVALVELSFLIPSFKRLHCGQLNAANIFSKGAMMRLNIPMVTKRKRRIYGNMNNEPNFFP